MGGSAVALEASFESQDPKFLDELLNTHRPNVLANLASKWFEDPRPPMRRLLLDYIATGVDTPHHQPLVKRVFKAAEAANDHEVIGHFAVAFDQLVKRRVARSWGYDWQTKTSTVSEYLSIDRSVPKG